MKLTPVLQSEAIKAIGYDPAARELHVQFHSGATYVYPGVSPEQHTDFLNSDSKGRHFQAHIRARVGVRSAA